ncbi:MAG: glycosyltransferase [Sphingomicrobium sp.]
MRHEPIRQFEEALALEAGVDVTIVMPCLNEAQCLPYCIANAKEALERIVDEYGLRGEIVVADNGSTDGSQALATRLGARVVPVPERGYGAALIGGSRAAYGQYVLMGDADGSYDFTDGVAMIGKLQDGADLCMGSRFKGGISRGAMPWKNRYIGNPVLTGILNLFFRPGISDAHSGLRAMRKDAFLELGLSGSGMEFASEMVIKAALKRLCIAETPVKLLPDLRDRAPHLRPWRDGWRHLRYLFMLSPTWVFGVPALAAIASGIAILATALFRAFGWTGPVPFGESWIVIGALLTATGHMAGMMGIASHLYGVREGYRLPKPWLLATRKWLSLEGCLAIGLGLLGLSLLTLTAIGIYWGSERFAALPSVLPVTLAGLSGAIGLQTLLGGFLLAVLGGNEADFTRAVYKEAGTGRAAQPAAGMIAEPVDGTTFWSRKLFGEAVRFGVVGSLNVVFNTMCIILLTELLSIHYIVSYLIVFSAATLIGFFLNRRWSFGIDHGAARKDLLRYVSFTIVTLLVGLAGIRVLDGLCGNYGIAVALVSAALAPINFFVHRTWSFGQNFRPIG